jgi:hypothetical protein
MVSFPTYSTILYNARDSAHTRDELKLHVPGHHAVIFGIFLPSL